MEKQKVMMSENRFVRFAKSQKKALMVIGLILLLSVIGELFVGNFISWNQALMTVKFAAFTALFGLCQMVVVSGGGNALDLSIGYIATLSAIFGVAVMNGSNGGLVLAILIALGIGLFFGTLNGLLISYFNLSPLVVTMSMSCVLQGIINVYASGMSISGTPSPVLQTLAAQSTATIPNIIFLLVVVVLVVYFIMKHTKYGPVLFGVGENPKTAYLSGANVKFTRCIVFTISGAIAGLIGLILAGNMGMAYKDMASSYLMPSYAAVVVGGISLKGGEGNYLRVVLGAVFLQVLTNLFILFGGGDAVKWMGYGVVLYILLLVYASERRKK
ncbi:ABC transporter permease [Christensenella timonensis]|uniref:ABC transporter permease n=1 Tax=Christensenella timonensis TaxID=1816678 RepID=UPI000831A82C|nr:ABC transporter permease [Christensenella timonensis]